MLSLDFDIIIVNTGPAGLRADFHLTDHSPSISLPMIDMKEICSGGLLKDCKQKYTYPIGFKTVNWTTQPWSDEGRSWTLICKLSLLKEDHLATTAQGKMLLRAFDKLFRTLHMRKILKFRV